MPMKAQDLLNFIENDLGVDIEGNFTNVVKQHWKKWFEKEFSTYVGEVKLTDSSMEKELNSYIKIPMATTSVTDLSETTFRVKNDTMLRLRAITRPCHSRAPFAPRKAVSSA